jgi:hypothetical protein
LRSPPDCWKIDLLCGARAAYHHPVNRFRSVGYLLILLFSSQVIATKAALRPVENRYLFILEISKEMKREEKVSKNVVAQLIYTGVMGQMKAGDTFGIWTYNDTLHAGAFPVQTFVWEDRESIARRTMEYLDEQKFTGAAHLENALLPMLKLVTNSPNLTVILVSDGKQAVAGTPYDREIRALHNKYYEELHDAKLPFITALVANHGEFISYAVSSSLGPVRIPKIPKPPVQTNAVAAVKPKVIKRPEPLVLRGALPKNNTTETTSTPAPVVSHPVETAKAGAAAVQPTTESSALVAPTPAPAVVPIVKEPEPVKPAEPTPAPVEPKKAEAPAPAVVIAPPVIKEQTSNVSSLVVQEEKSVASPSIVPTEKAVVPVPVTEPEAPKSPAVESKTATKPAVLAQTEVPSTLRNVLIVIGLILFFILLVLVLMLRKSKHTHPSLISQSINKSDQ